MKFTHQLKFNSVPEWREHYIQYAHLKKYIYALAKKEADLQAGGQLVADEEGLYAPLLDAARQGGQVRCVVAVFGGAVGALLARGRSTTALMLR